MNDTEQLAGTPENRDKNAYVGVCTECGLEDSLPVSNAEELPDVGETVTGFICDCENTTWDVTGYDRVVFQRESRYELGPDISGTEHNYGVIEWKHLGNGEYPHPECPVRQLGSTDKAVGCSRIAERFTDQEGRGAWRCPWHGHFRVIDYPRDDDDATEQATIDALTDGGETPARQDAGMDRSPFDEKTDSIATVLDDLPPMQVLRAVQQLAEDPDARMEAGDVRTTAANISTDEDLRSLIGRGESLDPSSTATGGGDSR